MTRVDQREPKLRAKRPGLTPGTGDILYVEAGPGEIVTRRTTQVAPSVQRLLAEFNEDTVAKLRIAPADSRPTIHLSDGTLREIDAEGWVRAPGEEDTPPTIDVDPISVIDTPERAQLPQSRAELRGPASDPTTPLEQS
uniref:hypothetical protein n=1 Tax=Nocardia suismassiliense TaxID=2077092 RepID=UPI003F495107